VWPRYVFSSLSVLIRHLERIGCPFCCIFSECHGAFGSSMCDLGCSRFWPQSVSVCSSLLPPRRIGLQHLTIIRESRGHYRQSAQDNILRHPAGGRALCHWAEQFAWTLHQKPFAFRFVGSETTLCCQHVLEELFPRGSGDGGVGWFRERLCRLVSFVAVRPFMLASAVDSSSPPGFQMLANLRRCFRLAGRSALHLRCCRPFVISPTARGHRVGRGRFPSDRQGARLRKRLPRDAVRWGR